MTNLSLILSLAFISLVGARLQNSDFFQQLFEKSEESTDRANVGASSFRSSGSNQGVIESSSCDGLFNVINLNGFRSGIVAIPNPKPGTNFIKLVLSYPANFANNERTIMTPLKDDASSQADIDNGQPLLYSVIFPYQNIVPLATAIYYNEMPLCIGPPAVAMIVTTTVLQGSYSALDNQSILTRPKLPRRTTSRTTTRRTTTRRTTTRRTTSRIKPTPDSSSGECGNPEHDTSGEIHVEFVIGGKEPARGQFPWLAAMKANDQFLCAGSLINSKMVLTAAHCIQGKSMVVRRREITFVLGGHNLDEDERNSVSSGVSKLIVHDDWMASDSGGDADADLALAVLTKTISFTKFIKPICLWTTTSSYDDAIGMKASIAGWGKTARDVVSTDHPNYVEVPIVEMEACKNSSNVFRKIASDRTFCAGDLSVSKNPCSGDSGGGLVVKSGDKWYLRGLVSHGLVNTATQKCLLRSYVMYTDVAAFKDWIQEIVDEFL